MLFRVQGVQRLFFREKYALHFVVNAVIPAQAGIHV